MLDPDAPQSPGPSPFPGPSRADAPPALHLACPDPLQGVLTRRPGPRTLPPAWLLAPPGPLQLMASDTPGLHPTLTPEERHGV